MPIDFDSQSMTVQMIWEGGIFATGGASTSLAFNTDLNGALAIDGFMDVIKDAWDAQLRAVTDQDITLATLQWETATLSGEHFCGLAGGGGITGPPSNCALLASYKAAFKGPRNRGRNYWPGLLTEGSVDEGGVVLTATLTSLALRFDNFWGLVEAHPNVLGQVIAQSTTPGQQTPPNHPWPIVLTRTLQPKIGTQRRRVRP